MAVSLPEFASMPSPETATAAEPALGHGSAGTVPAVVDWPGTAAVTGTAGIGRKKLKVRKAAIRSSSTPAIRSRIPDKIAAGEAGVGPNLGGQNPRRVGVLLHGPPFSSRPERERRPLTTSSQATSTTSPTSFSEDEEPVAPAAGSQTSRRVI